MRKILALMVSMYGLFVWGGTPYALEDNKLVLPRCIEFPAHGNDVKDTSDAMLEYVAQYLRDKPYITKLRVESHVFTEKTPTENLSLSLQRAALVSYYLTQKGIDCNRLVPVAFGDTKPVDTTGSVINTRLEFFNAELNGQSIGGMPVDGAALKKYNPCE
jgi:hypothetical protein